MFIQYHFDHVYVSSYPAGVSEWRSLSLLSLNRAMSVVAYLKMTLINCRGGQKIKDYFPITRERDAFGETCTVVNKSSRRD